MLYILCCELDLHAYVAYLGRQTSGMWCTMERFQESTTHCNTQVTCYKKSFHKQFKTIEEAEKLL
jgi:hypothetical protein